MWTRVTALVFAAIASTACAGGDDGNGRSDSAAPSAASDAASTERQHNACRLLTHEEVSAFVEGPITLADQIEAEPGYSVCQWENKGFVALKLVVYWKGGKQQWDVWRTAQGLADDVFTTHEGVTLDSIVEQGPVAGLGDAAYFSELLPSLVLKDDVLFEINNQLAPKAAAKFRPLASKLISRI